MAHLLGPFILATRLTGHRQTTAEDLVVLVLHGHYSCIRNIDAIDSGRQNHCLPTAPQLPQDAAVQCSIYGKIEQWVQSSPGRAVTAYQIGELFGRAYMKAATAEAAANGFCKAGLFPSNRNIFRPSEFAVLDKPNETGDISPHHADREPQPGTSRNTGPTAVTGIIRPANISPVPTTETQLTARKSRTGSAQTHHWLHIQKTMTRVSEKGAQIQATREGNNSLETSRIEETSPPSQDKD
jgi:hypothetical protein